METTIVYRGLYRGYGKREWKLLLKRHLRRRSFSMALASWPHGARPSENPAKRGFAKIWGAFLAVPKVRIFF